MKLMGPDITGMAKVNSKKRNAETLKEVDDDSMEPALLTFLNLKTDIDQKKKELRSCMKRLKDQEKIVGELMNLDSGNLATLKDENGNQLALVKAEWSLKMFSAIAVCNNDGDEEEIGE